MTFSEYLTQLIETRKLSKNMLIRETGIDRSSFFQFLKGSRKPTGSQLTKIALAAGFNTEERDLLHELYVKEKHGEQTCRIWKTIRENLEKLDTMSPGEPEDTPVTRYLKQVCSTAESVSRESSPLCFDFFIPISYFVGADISSVLASLGRMFAGTVSVRVILVNFSDQDLPEQQLIEVCLQSILLAREPRLDLELYHYQGKYQRKDIPLIGFPFFILGSQSILMINDLTDQYTVLEDKGFLRQYADSFRGFLKKCRQISYRNRDALAYAKYLQQALRYSDSELLYTVEFLPCVFSVSPLDMVEKYTPPVFEGFARQYVSLFHGVIHMKQYFSPEGFDVFRKERRLYMAGGNVQLDREDTETLCSLIIDKLGPQYACLDPSRLRMSEEWCIASGRKALLFASFAKENVFVVSLDPQICGAFYNYFAHLEEDGAALLPEAAKCRLKQNF